MVHPLVRGGGVFGILLQEVLAEGVAFDAKWPKGKTLKSSVFPLQIVSLGAAFCNEAKNILQKE